MVKITGNPATPTHAGAVTFRRDGNTVVFLVISSSDASSRVLPKGHIEAGESPEAAAIRELREEAGVTGRVIAALSSDEFVIRKKRVVARYFLVEYTGMLAPKESRIIHWVDLASALNLLSFEGLRRLLREGAERLHESPDAG